MCTNSKEITAEEATKILADRFRQHVGMLFLAPHNQLSSSSIRFNGTAAFIDTGSAKLIITNDHVFRRFTELRQEEPELRMFVTGSNPNMLIELSEAHLIARGGKDADLAIFSLGNPLQLEDIGKTYFPASPWPPQRPVPGTAAVIIGFQGVHRIAVGTNLQINLTVICDRITSSSQRHLILVDEEQARTIVKLNAALDELGPLGGMSGSPAFTVGPNGDATIVGFLYETGEGADAMVFAVHADIVTSEGKIDYGLIL
jgi:hypothetical protein